MTLQIGNAAGMISWPEGTVNLRLDEIERLAQSAATDVTIGPLTLEPRKGNKGETYYYHPVEQWSLNSKGLPSLGAKKFGPVIRQIAEIVHRYGKKLRVTVAAFSPLEYAVLTACAFENGADEVEENLGCPNVWGEDGTQKPIPSHHPRLVSAILHAVKGRLKAGQIVDVKISPVPDTTLNLLAAAFHMAGCVANVVAVNTEPNVDRLRENGKHALDFNGGNHVGGLAGKPLKEEALRVVHTLRQILSPSIGVTGVGGIFTGEDAFELLEAGANRIQIGTAFREEGPRIFSHVLQGLTDIPKAAKYLE